MDKLDEFRTITQAEIATVAQGLIDQSEHPVVEITVLAMLKEIINVIESPRLEN